jgi:hypothetical protein
MGRLSTDDFTACLLPIKDYGSALERQTVRPGALQVVVDTLTYTFKSLSPTPENKALSLM